MVMSLLSKMSLKGEKAKKTHALYSIASPIVLSTLELLSSINNSSYECFDTLSAWIDFQIYWFAIFYTFVGDMVQSYGIKY